MEETVLDIILDIVKDYNLLTPDYSNISDLMYSRKQLATYLVTFSIEVSNARKNWKEKESDYEIEKNQLRLKYIEKGTTKADWTSRANTEDQLKESVRAESLFYDADYVLKSVKEVLSEMNQRISYLKSENDQNRFKE